MASDGSGPHTGSGLSVGVLVEIAGSFLSAVYYVSFRKFATRGGALPPDLSALVAGFQGLMNLSVLWLGMPLLSAAGFEPFGWPDHAQLRTLAIGATLAAVGNVTLLVALALLPNPLIVSVGAWGVLTLEGVYYAWDCACGGRQLGVSPIRDVGTGANQTTSATIQYYRHMMETLFYRIERSRRRAR